MDYSSDYSESSHSFNHFLYEASEEDLKDWVAELKKKLQGKDSKVVEFEWKLEDFKEDTSAEIDRLKWVKFSKKSKTAGL